MKTNFCECTEDGYCQRFRREMVGRFRQICAGVDCDLGTSAAFRLQWAGEAALASSSRGAPPAQGDPMKVLLKVGQAPGDAVCMTAAIHSLHAAHPGKYITAVESPYPEVFEHNPHVAEMSPSREWQELCMHYPAIHESNQRGIHFMQGWCEFLGFALGVEVPLTTSRPHLYFPDDDPEVEDFWLVCSGGKGDMTAKDWGREHYQEVVDILGEEVKFVQVGDNTKLQPALEGAKYLVGQTSLRNLFWWARRARGVLCGVSLLMHVAAALNKPAVVVAGGREPVQWNSYSRQQYVHTVGMLQCTSAQGHVGEACWRSRVLPRGDGSTLDGDLCERPVGGLPQCMRMIKPEHVANLVRQYDEQYNDDDVHS